MIWHLGLCQWKHNEGIMISPLIVMFSIIFFFFFDIRRLGAQFKEFLDSFDWYDLANPLSVANVSIVREFYANFLMLCLRLLYYNPSHIPEALQLTDLNSEFQGASL